MPFVVIYDANALFGNTQRDLLIRLAQSGLVQAKWTHAILDEVQRTSPRSCQISLQPSWSGCANW